MKKVMALLLAVVMLLCGCSTAIGTPDGSGGQAADNGGQGIGDFFSNIVDSIGDAVKKEEEPLLELGEGPKHESLMVLKITINPEFELYLDMDSCISRVRCLNEDAVTAFQNITGQGINVIGMAYTDAMQVILDGMTATGFLTAETEQIQIEATVHIEAPEEDLANLAAALAEPVEAYSIENELALTVEAPAPEVDTEVALELPEFEMQKAKPNAVITYEALGSSGASGTYTEYYDGNGILYKTEGRYEDGSYSNAEFASNGCMIYHENIAADGTGNIETYDEYGNQTGWVGIHADGERHEATYHSNGNPATSVHTYSDGRYSEESWTKSGVPISAISVGADGSRHERIWYKNGNIKSMITDDTMGHLENHYFEDGTVSKVVDRRSDGQYHEAVYYPNGQVAVSIGNNGERHYDESGKMTYEKYEDGVQSYLIENGKLVYYIENGAEVTDPKLLANIAAAMGCTS